MKSEVTEAGGAYWLRVPEAFLRSAGLLEAVEARESVRVLCDYDRVPSRFSAVLRDLDDIPTGSGETVHGVPREDYERLMARRGSRTSQESVVVADDDSVEWEAVRETLGD